MREGGRQRDEAGGTDGGKKNVAKFLVPDLLRPALPILRVNFPSVVKHLLLPRCPHCGKGGGKKQQGKHRQLFGQTTPL